MGGKRPLLEVKELELVIKLLTDLSTEGRNGSEGRKGVVLMFAIKDRVLLRGIFS